MMTSEDATVIERPASLSYRCRQSYADSTRTIRRRVVLRRTPNSHLPPLFDFIASSRRDLPTTVDGPVKAYVIVISKNGALVIPLRTRVTERFSPIESIHCVCTVRPCKVGLLDDRNSARLHLILVQTYICCPVGFHALHGTIAGISTLAVHLEDRSGYRRMVPTHKTRQMPIDLREIAQRISPAALQIS